MRKSTPILVNLSLLSAAQVVAQVLNLISLIFLARYLGDYWFGVVQVGVAVSAYALITAEWGLNSLGIMKSGVWSKPAIRSARLVLRKLILALVRTSSIADSRLSPMSSLTESRCPANGLPRNRS